VETSGFSLPGQHKVLLGQFFFHSLLKDFKEAIIHLSLLQTEGQSLQKV
jgi:hypothetical protein